MTRRTLLGGLAAFAAGLTLDPERALWVPGQRTYLDLHIPPLWDVTGYAAPLTDAMGYLLPPRVLWTRRIAPIDTLILLPEAASYIDARLSEVNQFARWGNDRTARRWAAIRLPTDRGWADDRIGVADRLAWAETYPVRSPITDLARDPHYPGLTWRQERYLAAAPSSTIHSLGNQARRGTARLTRAHMEHTWEDPS